jgi:hypothetical protein
VTRRVGSPWAGIVGALGLAGCGFGLGFPDGPVRDLDPAPDGRVLEPARGEAGGVPWAFGVYRSGEQVCTYVVADTVVQGPACGPLDEGRALGPFGAGGMLVGGWTYVGGVAGRDVVEVRILLEGGARAEISTTSIDEVGVDASAFFVPLEPGVIPAVVVAVDDDGRELERVQIGPLEVPTPAEPPVPSG